MNLPPYIKTSRDLLGNDHKLSESNNIKNHEDKLNNPDYEI